MKNNAGIDYGRGLTNIDQETGIRDGVISQNEVLQAWADSSQPYWGDIMNEDDMGMADEPLSYCLDDGEYMAECGDDGDIFVIKSPFYTLCRFCSPCAPGAGYLMDYYTPAEKAKEQLILVENIAPLAIGEAFQSWGENDGYIKAYCFGHDWFDNEQAPYKVFDVKTGMEVKANE